MLALREVKRDCWSNLIGPFQSTPCGAGMCVRRSVAVSYSDCVQRDPVRQGLDRKGQCLISGGDDDLAFTTSVLGLGMGQFTRLRLTHLIPASRLQLDYMTRLAEGMGYSQVILYYLWGIDMVQNPAGDVGY